MSTPLANDVFHWYADCINRQTKERVRKHFVLDETLMTDVESREFRAIMRNGRCDRRILQFRKHFKECAADELHALMLNCDRFATVNSVLPPDGAFEDDNGIPMDELDLIDLATGQTDTVIRGNVRSAYRLGPAPIKRKADWTIDKANDIAHFLNLVRQIQLSHWENFDLSLTIQGGRILDCKHPDRESTRSFLLSMRQLLMPARLDDAFNVACGIYSAHVSNPKKAIWVQHEQDKFAHARKAVPFPFQLDTYTMEEVIDMMIYGAGLAHRKSRDKWELRLPEIIEKHGKERFQFVFHGSCKTLLDFAYTAAPIINQDFTHWVINEGCVRPNRVWESELF